MTNLKNLSDPDLLSQTKLVVSQERNQTAAVLRYLREVERRRLYLEKSYSSMFVFCIKELGYDENQTQRRLSAMRLMTEIPEIEPKIASGELSLTALNKAKVAFNKMAQKSNKASSDISCAPYGGTSKDFSENSASLSSGSSPCSSSTSLNSPEKSQSKFSGPLSTRQKLEILKTLENKSIRECEKELVKVCPETLPKKLESQRALTEELVELKLVIKKETLEKLVRLKDLRAHKSTKMADLLDFLADLGLHESDPATKKKRANNTPQHFPEKVTARKDLAKTIKTEKVRSQETEASQIEISREENSQLLKPQELKSQNPMSRYVPQSIRRQVWQRDQGKCQFSDLQTGKKCGSTFKIQLEHMKPFSLGGGHSLQNLTLYCHAHNIHQAVRVFGVTKMARFGITQASE